MINISHTVTPPKPCATFNEWACYIRSQSLENRISDQLRNNVVKQFNIQLNKLQK